MKKIKLGFFHKTPILSNIFFLGVYITAIFEFSCVLFITKKCNIHSPFSMVKLKKINNIDTIAS